MLSSEPITRQADQIAYNAKTPKSVYSIQLQYL